MYDEKSGEWVVEGLALDIDTIFRTRDYMIEQAYEEMKAEGFFPLGPMPLVDLNTNVEPVEFTFRWKCAKR